MVREIEEESEDESSSAARMRDVVLRVLLSPIFEFKCRNVADKSKHWSYMNSDYSKGTASAEAPY